LGFVILAGSKELLLIYDARKKPLCSVAIDAALDFR
jgi:hypothetical protein